MLHITSLPGPYGIGELGPEAVRFADWLAAAGQRVWQVLPLGPTGYGESPYQLFSAFAGNPLLISIDVLVERGWLTRPEIGPVPHFAANRVEFERLIPWKMRLLRRAFENFRANASGADRATFEAFQQQNAAWLDDYARFMGIKEAQGNVAWIEWDPDAGADQAAQDFHRFTQFEFFRQWDALKTYCGDRDIRLMGDLPIYVAHDSADVWAHRELFQLDENGRPLAVSGVPPDYFSATGQLWGNPLYRWDRMAGNGFRWWIERMRAALRLFDAVRMDHFRGFEAYWEVPASEKTAVNGRWVKGPGAQLLRALETALGKLPVVAENLGVITPEVEALREEFGLPGMAILQFAFGKDPQAHSFRPHNYVRNLVAYTGTHDNDTAAGWWRSEGGDSTRTPQDVQEEKAAAGAYLAGSGKQIHWLMIRSLMSSVADTVLFPMQDVLGLGSEARMNTPAVASGNWRWRCRAASLRPEVAGHLRELSGIYERGVT